MGGLVGCNPGDGVPRSREGSSHRSEKQFSASNIARYLQCLWPTEHAVLECWTCVDDDVVWRSGRLMFRDPLLGQ